MSPRIALDLYDPRGGKWMMTRAFDTEEGATNAMIYSAQQFSGPETSRFRVRDMDSDRILRDKIVIRRPPQEGEEHALFHSHDPANFVKVVFEWHTVH